MASTSEPLEADRLAALRAALAAGSHPDAPDPADIRPYGPDDPLPPEADEALATRMPELTERARRQGLT